MGAQTGYVLGVDVGGTSTRVLLAEVGGRRVGTATGPGANPNAHPPAVAAARVGETIRAALGAADPGAVRAGVLGLAGHSTLTDPGVRRLFTDSWADVGLDCPMRAVADSVAAFAAGTTAASGTVLVAGTGSAAARIDDRQLSSTVGGHGWLLGDEGSAFWLGREAIRHALTVLDARQADPVAVDGLADEVLSAVIGDGWREFPARRAVELLLTAAHTAPPIDLARFAPYVSAAAQRGNRAAAALADRAVLELATLITRTRIEGDRTPIVLTGSVLTPGGPIGDGLRSHLAACDAGPVHTATDAAAGAAWLAALTLDDLSPDAAESLHRNMIG